MLRGCTGSLTRVHLYNFPASQAHKFHTWPRSVRTLTHDATLIAAGGSLLDRLPKDLHAGALWQGHEPRRDALWSLYAHGHRMRLEPTRSLLQEAQERPGGRAPTRLSVGGPAEHRAAQHVPRHRVSHF